MADFLMPSLGADMEAGELVEWLIKPGDTVARGDIVAVVETAKGAIDIEIFQAGTITELVVPIGQRVPVGAVLARLDREQRVTPAAPTPVSGATPAPPEVRVRATPLARRRAQELGVELGSVRGTGPSGAITVDDVERLTPPTNHPQDMRTAIAAAMARANREIPHYYLTHPVDLEPSLRWLETVNLERSVRNRMLPAALLGRATALALQKHPGLNGHWANGRFQPVEAVHLGIAVSMRGGGLVAPALRDAAELSLEAFMERLWELVACARSGGLRSSEIHGATATLTNLGDRGVDTVHGIIHPPQVALIGFGAVALRPWVLDGAVVPRRLVRVSLSGDHRATDGHLGAKFLQTVDRLLQEPSKL